MKKILPLFFLFILTSCAGASQIIDPTNTPKPLPSPAITRNVPTLEPVIELGAEPGSLKGTQVAYWYALSGEQAALMEQNIASFSLANPYGVSIISKRFNTLYEMEQALAENSASPGVILWSAEYPLPGVSEPIDLNPYFKLGGYEIDPENYLSDATGSSLPFTRSARFLVYNTSFAGELGYSALPATFDQFTEQVCGANAAWRSDDDQTNDSFGGYLFDGEPNWQDPVNWMANSDSIENDPLEKGKAALDSMQSLRDDSCAWYLPEVNKFEQLRERKTLVIGLDAQDIPALDGIKAMYSITDELSVGAFPGKYDTLTYGLNVYIPRTDPKTQLAAYLFARWLTEDVQQIEWVKDTGLLPVTRTSLEKLLADRNLPGWQMEELVILPNAGSLADHPELSEQRTLIGDGFYQWVTRYPYVTIDEIWSEIVP